MLLDGNGADEIFLGYKKYHIEYLYGLKDSDGFDQALFEYCRFWNETTATACGRIANLDKYTSMIDGSPHLGAIHMGDALFDATHYNIPTVNTFDSSVRNLAARDLLYTKVPRGLRFNDRMSMMHSRELRVPFLDHEVVELVLSAFRIFD